MLIKIVIFVAQMLISDAPSFRLTVASLWKNRDCLTIARSELDKVIYYAVKVYN